MNVPTNLLILLFAAFTLNGASAQSKGQISELADLCKVWGTLKYFHPEIASGNRDWDSVLVASLDRLLVSNKEDALRREVDRMLQIAGENDAPLFTIDKSAHPYTYRNVDHSWVDKSRNLTESQKKALTYNYAHPKQGGNYYALNNPDDDGNIITPNEKPYSEMKMPDRNYRLLGLFRFWNVINYYYPYKYAAEEKWNNVLTNLIPDFVTATDTSSYHKAVLKMAASIDDGHGGVYPFLYESVAGKYSPPFFFQLVDNKAVVTKILNQEIAQQANVQQGSVIEKIDGTSLATRIKQLWDYIPASNTGGKYKGLHRLILNSKSPSSVYSGYNPDGSTFHSKIALSERNFLKEYLAFFAMNSPITARKITRDIAYVNAANITSENIDSIMLPLMDTEAIILDLRNYPSLMPSYKMADYFLKEPTPYGKETMINFNYPGLLYYRDLNSQHPSIRTVGKENPDPYSGKLILLVDHRTQSLPEFDCLILKTYENTTVIGTQTAGADGNVTRMTFLGGHTVSFSGMGIYGPDGSETQRVGIPIDIQVDYEVNDVVNQEDPILKRAIRFAETGE
ncbi:S41 family peptidase [Lewinella sp. IMCC34191]|uniref:S41 family peptidase n=1 Tax=Lewinella sp. IMCC34191 TaxID=2259172 RepID=UPI000E243DB9|nr:S41 family peptidase [Lewinella sp. IMCC34191]